jgi:hypothetical protein
MILGISNLNLIFAEDYYEGLEGGILEAIAKLFPDNTRLYIYPSLCRQDKNTLVTADSFIAPDNLKHLYQHLLENGYLIGLNKVDESLLTMSPAKLLSGIQKGRGDWESLVPEAIAEMIINNKLFGFGNS